MRPLVYVGLNTYVGVCAIGCVKWEWLCKDDYHIRLGMTTERILAYSYPIPKIESLANSAPIPRTRRREWTITKPNGVRIIPEPNGYVTEFTMKKSVYTNCTHPAPNRIESLPKWLVFIIWFSITKNQTTNWIVKKETNLRNGEATGNGKPPMTKLLATGNRRWRSNRARAFLVGLGECRVLQIDSLENRDDESWEMEGDKHKEGEGERDLRSTLWKLEEWRDQMRKDQTLCMYKGVIL